MRRLLFPFLCALVALAVAACGNGDTNEASPKAPDTSEDVGKSGLTQKKNGTSVDLPENAPPAPAIEVERDGNEVVVNYSFSEMPADPESQPWLLLVSVDSLATDLPPITVRREVAADQGTATAPVGLGGPPFIVRVASLTRSGLRGEVVSERLE